MHEDKEWHEQSQWVLPPDSIELIDTPDEN
jgi:hypothetical protein